MSVRTWSMGAPVVVVAALFVLLFAGLGSREARADRLKVAVIPGVAINLDTSRVDAISQDLAEALSTELDVDVIGGLEVRRQLPADGLPDECATTPACGVETAELLGVDQLLFIVLVNTGAGGSIQMDTTWVDPRASQRVTRPAIDLATIDSAKERFAAGAKKLLPDAPVRRKPTVSQPPSVRFDDGKPRHFTALSLTTAGVTLAALGSGIGFGLSARSRYKECDDTSPCKDGEKKELRARAVIADVSFVVALASAITTAVLYGSSSEAPRVIVAPNAEGGAAVTGMMRF